MPPPAPRPGKRSRAARRYLKSPPSSPATCGVVASAFLLLPVVLRSRAVRRLGGRSWAELGGALIASDARAVITLDRRGRRARRGRAGAGRRRRRAATGSLGVGRPGTRGAVPEVPGVGRATGPLGFDGTGAGFQV